MKDTFHRGTGLEPGRTLTILKEGDYHNLLQNQQIVNKDDQSSSSVYVPCGCQRQNYQHLNFELDHNANSDEVWGMCYKISFSQAEKVMKDLDFRELVAGYHKTTVKVYVADNIVACHNAVVYYFDPFNCNLENNPFVGPENICCTSKYIARSFGYSGPNRDYLYRLQEYLPTCDSYVEKIVKFVRAIESHHPMNHTIQSILQKEESKGSIFVDQGATSALSQRCKNLLACGIRNVIGDFERDDVVEVVDIRTNRVIAKGFSNMHSSEIRQIQGKNSKTLFDELISSPLDCPDAISESEHPSTPSNKLQCSSQSLSVHHHVIPQEVISKSRMILL